MHPELLQLIQAYDAAIEVAPVQAARAVVDYENRVTEALDRHPGLSRETLHRMVKKAHQRWIRAQRTNPTIPPSA